MTEQSAKIALITGGSRGLGRTLVKVFSFNGYFVYSGYNLHRPEELQENECPVKLDVTNSGEIKGAIERIKQEFGRLDVLINNAGIAIDKLIINTRESDWDSVIDVNLKGAFLCSKYALELMISKRDGHIINITSFVGRYGKAGQGSYSASKAGIIGLTQSMAKEYGRYNIRINAIMPGYLNTDMTKGLDKDILQSAIQENVLGRFNTLEEVARFCLFLVSTNNISGQIFQLDSRIGRWT